jgi:DNA-binding NtrC family response regulator
MAPVARVLAVDDDPMILELLTAALTPRGYEVVTVENGGDALMLLEASAVDVVLLDVGMPGLDGMSALRRIREVHPALPVIMLTGNVDVAVGRDSLQRGAFDYVTKPVDFDHLVRVLEAAVVQRG